MSSNYSHGETLEKNARRLALFPKLVEGLEKIAVQTGGDFRMSFYHMRDIARGVLEEVKGEI